MSSSSLYRVLLGIIESEKASDRTQKHNIFSFRINQTANKLDVVYAVESIFKVKVNRVNILNVKGKKKRFGNRWGSRREWRKAYVRLEPGFDLNFNKDF
ncbi:50S ribosomal subunit protein L23 [Gammaproteobacteria bacterium]